MRSVGVKVGMTCPITAQRASTVRAAAFRSICLEFGDAFDRQGFRHVRRPPPSGRQLQSHPSGVGYPRRFNQLGFRSRFIPATSALRRQLCHRARSRPGRFAPPRGGLRPSRTGPARGGASARRADHFGNRVTATHTPSGNTQNPSHPAEQTLLCDSKPLSSSNNPGTRISDLHKT
jgi:hypothetical protein